MNKLGKLIIYGYVLIFLCVLSIRAEPKPEPAKGLFRSDYFNEAANSKYRSVPQDDDEVDEDIIAEFRENGDEILPENDDSSISNKEGSSKGRLFTRKFLLFKNMFGNAQQQPVIPIIITGAANGGNTAPVVTTTSTGTVPTAVGTITTGPITGTANGGANGAAGGVNRRVNSDDEEENVEQNVSIQALQAALAAGAQEYVVTDQEIKGTSDSKATKQENINIRPKGSQRGKVIRLRIPPQYRQYFTNGQKVVLNGNNRQKKRRVVRKKNNKNYRRGNKNSRNRYVPIA